MAEVPAATTSGFATYPGSTVVSQSPYATTTRTADQVGAVSAYYDNAIAAGGWTVVSRVVTEASGSHSVVKDGMGASISIYYADGGSGISTSTWPR